MDVMRVVEAYCAASHLDSAAGRGTARRRRGLGAGWYVNRKRRSNVEVAVAECAYAYPMSTQLCCNADGFLLTNAGKIAGLMHNASLE